MASESPKVKAAREHVEDIRKRKFSIGAENPNPLTQDLHNAVTRLSSELYTKDIHFLMELIQNAEDNTYSSGVEPTLEFLFTKEDITGVGSPATLVVFNNEVGFSKADIESLCSIGQSTKKGKRCQGFIGEKGIGFKSVFLVSAHPHVFSNGYQICFNEVPTRDCGIGYIVPEWINAKPPLLDLKRIHKSENDLPNTIIILPLKAEKVEAVKKELAQIHPEILLFLQKIKRLTVQEHHADEAILSSISALSISTETKLVSRDQVADSRIVHISVQPIDTNIPRTTCLYYLHKQTFPVRPEDIVDQRKDVKQYEICLAFPLGKRLRTGSSAIGIFSFLPTSMVTNFPFIIHSDFVLASSREAILFDNKWNVGILEHVASAFAESIVVYLQNFEASEDLSIDHMLEFFPKRKSSFKQLNKVRDSIQNILQEKQIVPCQSFVGEKMNFHQPTHARRILPEFRNILTCLKQHGVPLDNLYSKRKYVIHNSFDNRKYEDLWDFLDLPLAYDFDWYARCIDTCNFLNQASQDIYIQLVRFFAGNWTHFPFESVRRMNLLKYVNRNGAVSSCSSDQITRGSLKIFLVREEEKHTWTRRWNTEMGCPDNVFFLADELFTVLKKDCQKQSVVKEWLTDEMGVSIYDLNEYCKHLVIIMRRTHDPKVVGTFAHFLYHVELKNYVGANDISKILQAMPVVDRSGSVSLCSPALVPASEGKWVKLFGSKVGLELCDEKSKEHHDLVHKRYMSPDQSCGVYTELGAVYLEPAKHGDDLTPATELMNFLVKHGKASDLPYLIPANKALEVASSELTSDQGLLLLEWIKNLRSKTHDGQTHGNLKDEIPARFIESIKSGKWLKTYSGFTSPRRCYLNGGIVNQTVLDMGRAMKILSAIDEPFYSHALRSYEDELTFIGVQIRNENASKSVIRRLVQFSSLNMSNHLALKVLDFVRYLREENKFDDQLKKSLQEGKWLKTLQGFQSPVGSICLTPSEEKAIDQIANVPIVDRLYYGDKLNIFQNELNFLGVVVNFEDACQLISVHFRFPQDLSSLTKDSVLLLLKCMKFISPGEFARDSILKVSSLALVKTDSGFRCPKECLLSDPRWEYLLNAVSFPVIDESYYGTEIRSYTTELQSIGVIVDPESAKLEILEKLKFLVSSAGFSSAQLISLLKFLRYSRDELPSLVSSVVFYLSSESWVKTKLGSMHVSKSILFDANWPKLSHLVNLPVIDEGFYGEEIYSFRNEFKMLGVKVNFGECITFVAQSLELPEECLITAEMSFSLLQYAASLFNNEESSDRSLVDDSLQKLRVSKWLKTHLGYRCPHDALLFDMEWEGSLKELDGPFIDQEFYKGFISVEDYVFRALGVKTGIKDVCNLLFKNLTSHVETSRVKRIYHFLKKFDWTPKSQDNASFQIWIPKGIHGGGKWLHSDECVIHDADSLFTHHLHVLDKHYDSELLSFFSHAFSVAWVPNLQHYVQLYKFWLETICLVTLAELNRFLTNIVKIWDWDLSTRRTIGENMTMLPAADVSGKIHWVKKEELYIPDDFLLQKAFTESSNRPLFVCIPPDSFLSANRLLDLYVNLGVKRLSESVQYSVDGYFLKMENHDKFITKPLIKIVLAFLASSQMNMPTEVRHWKAKSLLDISIHGTEVPLIVRYSLTLPLSCKKFNVTLHKKVFWDKNSNSVLVHQPSWRNEQENVQLVTDFSRAIAEAILSNCEGLMDLYKLIKMGFAFGLKESKINDLLITENIAHHLSAEDKWFIDHLFPPVHAEKHHDEPVPILIEILDDDEDEHEHDHDHDNHYFPEVKVEIQKVDDDDDDDMISETPPLSSKKSKKLHYCTELDPHTPDNQQQQTTFPSKKRVRIG